MYSNIKELVKAHNFVLIKYSLAYGSQLQIELPIAISHMADGLLEDILFY